jgi:N-acetylmuramoyl-L-alanine amidase
MTRRHHAAAIIFGALLCTFTAPAFAAATGAASKVDLVSEAKKQNIALSWDSFSSKGMLEKNGKVVLFRTDDTLIVLDYAAFTMTDAPTVENGRLIVTPAFLAAVNAFFSATLTTGMSSNDRATSTTMSSSDRATSDLLNTYRVGAIVIDPGHGGKDPGTNADYVIKGKKTRVNEKDIVLSVAKKLDALLRKAYPDKKIVLTRSTDVFLELQDRANIANNMPLGEKEAILFISLHVNANVSPKPRGFEVWFLTSNYRRQVLSPGDVDGDKVLFNIFNSMTEEEYTQESRLIAKYIMDGLDAQIGQSIPARGIKEESWAVVRTAKMPAVLVEMGFLSNEQEALYLINDSNQNKIAAGIASGIDTFVRNFELSRGFTASTT